MLISRAFLLACLLPSVTLAKGEVRCLPPEKNEPVVYSNEFSWGQSRAEMQKNFETIYENGKRLFGRAFFNESTKKFEMVEPYGTVALDPKFIASVTRHLEIALERGYAEGIFFPDMGHSHFYIPENEWPAFENEKDRARLYERLFSLRSLKVLYHTAEQLKIRGGARGNEEFPQDPTLLWRYFSRNVFADNNGGEDVAVIFRGPEGYNSVNEVEGYHLYSAGFYVSASKNGCFPFQVRGKKYYFDLAIAEMPYDNSKGGDAALKAKRELASGHQREK